MVPAGARSTCSRYAAHGMRPVRFGGVRTIPGQRTGQKFLCARWRRHFPTGPVRVATADVDIGGTIRTGEAVLPHTGSANFDQSHFASPTTFDITRRVNPHLGFGHDAHFCFGAPLARLEAQVALTALLRRSPILRLAVSPERIEWRPPATVRGPACVPVIW